MPSWGAANSEGAAYVHELLITLLACPSCSHAARPSHSERAVRAQDMITLISIVKGLLPTALVLRVCKYFAAALPSLRQEKVNEIADGVLQYRDEADVQALLQAIDSKVRDSVEQHDAWHCWPGEWCTFSGG